MTTYINTKEDAYKTLVALREHREALGKYDVLCAEGRRSITDEIDKLEMTLHEWTLANVTEKAKTIDLMVGKVSVRTVRGGPKVSDKAATLAWAREKAPEFVKVEVKEIETLDTKGLVEAIKGNDDPVTDLPPGVVIAPDTESFRIEFSEETVPA